jgi:hypothetical protein
MLARHRHTRGVDDVGLDVARPEPTRRARAWRCCQILDASVLIAVLCQIVNTFGPTLTPAAPPRI